MTSLEADLVSLVKRLARCLPTEHAVRREALDMLTKHGLVSPLREIAEPDEPKVKLCKLPTFNYYYGGAEFAPEAPDGINYAFKVPKELVEPFLEHLVALVTKNLENERYPAGMTCKLPFILSDEPKRLLAGSTYSNEEMEHLIALGWNPVRRHMHSFVPWSQNIVIGGRKFPMCDLYTGVHESLRLK